MSASETVSDLISGCFEGPRMQFANARRGKDPAVGCCEKPPMTGDGRHSTYENSDLGDDLLLFYHVYHVLIIVQICTI